MQESMATADRSITRYTDKMRFSPVSVSPGHRSISRTRWLFAEHIPSPPTWKGPVPTCAFHEILLSPQRKLLPYTTPRLTQPSKVQGELLQQTHSRELSCMSGTRPFSLHRTSSGTLQYK